MTELDAVTWHKSTYSANGGTCVEVGWRKSNHSSNGGSCVEVGWRRPAMLVRDTKDRDGGALAFPGTSWRTFLGQLTAGQAH